ncbi:MAG TPA: molybdopterin-dependent oxidoreductase [Anaerolineales bacterium]|nr:molybdopterin-dependent oxidoreductase [Anaerolineales bacterium]
MKRHLFLAILIAVIFLASCSAKPSQTTMIVSPAEIQIGDAIPLPSDPILTVSGRISTTNDGSNLLLDLATLEKFGLVKYEVNDPWLNEKNLYTGVLMSEFLKFVGAASDTTNVKLTALDDYQVDISIADIQKWPILLALQTNGEYMTVEFNGPTRIIFPFDDYKDIDQVAYKDLWIWNIRSMEIQ